MTTAPARVVRFLQGPTEDPTDMILPEFPVEEAKFVDALMLHPTRLKSLCADFDGDTCSWIPIFSKEANAECEKYIHTQGNYILPSGQPLADMFDDLIKLSMHAMTREPPELKK